MEKINCVHRKIKIIPSNASIGSIVESTDAVETSYCDYPAIDNDQLGELPCENCTYFKEVTKKD